ncbi:MAG: DUF5666 domain-containing protein [Proteobacteria bacterium]|nr:DUF5666 domain-containing protein [Pseudomonadota bacterium]
MKTKLFWRVLVGGLAVLALACGGGGGGSSSDGGGTVSQGEITGFGSVFVNGVRWKTGEASIRLDGERANEDDLRLGMIVIVRGERTGPGVGIASRVDFYDAIEGPVASIDVLDVDVKELMILGQRVRVERGVTEFDDDAMFDTLAVDQVLEVSGSVDADGTVRASHIESEGTLMLGATRVELIGTIEDLATDTFRLGTVTVTFDPSGLLTEFDDLPDGPQNGLRVEVEGVLTAADAINAEEIELADRLGDDVEDFETEGFISEFMGLGSFRVGDVLVDASGAELEPNDPASFRDGVRVEVEGSLRDGVLVAEELKRRGGVVELEAALASDLDVDPEAGIVTLLGVPILVDASTQIEDDRDGLEGFSLADLRAGDFLEVRGFQLDGAVIASHLERDDVDDVVVQGRLEAFDAMAGTVTLLGLEIPTDELTEFELLDSDVTQEDFFMGLLLGDVVKAQDDNDGDATTFDVADEVELEEDDEN